MDIAATPHQVVFSMFDVSAFRNLEHNERKFIAYERNIYVYIYIGRIRAQQGF